MGGAWGLLGISASFLCLPWHIGGHHDDLGGGFDPHVPDKKIYIVGKKKKSLNMFLEFKYYFQNRNFLNFFAIFFSILFFNFNFFSKLKKNFKCSNFFKIC